MSLATALLALIPLAIRARLKDEPHDELVAARLHIAELEATVESLTRRIERATAIEPSYPRGFGEVDAQRLAALAQYQQNAMQHQMLAMQQAQNAFAFYGESFAQICDCSPRCGRAGYLTGLGGLGA